MTDTTTKGDEWDAMSFVIASQYREGVLGRLAVRPAVPTQIATDTELRVEYGSRALRELREHSLVELLVPENRRKGRIYVLTDRGTHDLAAG